MHGGINLVCLSLWCNPDHLISLSQVSLITCEDDLARFSNKHFDWVDSMNCCSTWKPKSRDPLWKMYWYAQWEDVGSIWNRHMIISQHCMKALSIIDQTVASRRAIYDLHLKACNLQWTSVSKAYTRHIWPQGKRWLSICGRKGCNQLH